MAYLRGVYVISCEGCEEEGIEDGCFQEGEEDGDTGGELKFLIVLLHLQRIFRGTVAYLNGFVIHPQFAAGAHDRYFPFEIPPKPKFGGVPMKPGLADTGGVGIGFAIPFDFFLHGFFEAGHFYLVALDDLAHLIEVLAVQGRR